MDTHMHTPPVHCFPLQMPEMAPSQDQSWDLGTQIRSPTWVAGPSDLNHRCCLAESAPAGSYNRNSSCD